MAAPSWEHFAHGADVGIRGLGSTPAEAFAQAALALTAVVAEPGSVRLLESVTLACEAANLDDLLYDWIDALVFEMSAHRRLLGSFSVTIEDRKLRAEARGERIEPARHRPAVEVKGPTYTELSVARDGEGLWVAQCVVDV